MKLNIKVLKQLRRTLRREATEIVKFRKEINDGGMQDMPRWKSYADHSPAVVHRYLVAADVLDEIIKVGGHVIAGSAIGRQSRKRRKRSASAHRTAGHLRAVPHQSVQ
jgi:hypothetical protein